MQFIYEVYNNEYFYEYRGRFYNIHPHLKRLFIIPISHKYGGTTESSYNRVIKNVQHHKLVFVKVNYGINFICFTFKRVRFQPPGATA